MHFQLHSFEKIIQFFTTMGDIKNVKVYDCFEYKVEAYQYIVHLCALPFQSLLIKVLAKDLGFRMPRHIIMFSLSISDIVHPLSICICHLIASVFESGSDTALCHAVRETTMFIGVLTTVVSSLGIIALSVERYIACIHSFLVHRIFTHKRVIYGSIVQWMVGIVLGVTGVLTDKVNGMKMTKKASALQIILITFILSATLPVCAIQGRLFFFAKSKLKKVSPAGAYGAQLELADYRKKQIKVALVSGIVALGFVVCMVPTASLFCYEIINDTTVSISAKHMCFSLTLANCLVDPFIYGIGNVDTRKMIFRNLKKAKQLIIIRLFQSKIPRRIFTVQSLT